jgi:pimeloyl-ACP methyl ester carboxylesterase
MHVASIVSGLLILSLLAIGACAAPVATNLQGTCRQGQVFLTWDEPVGWDGRLTVLSSPVPITTENAHQATVISHHMMPGSARDWWLDPETFGNPLPVDPQTGEKPPIPREGFLLTPGGQRLNPDSGLHVHTVGPEEAGPRYFAVVSVGADGVENWEIVPGVNATTEAIYQEPAPVEPIWQNAGAPPDPSTGKRKALHLVLHAKTGRGGMDFLAFGDASLGWREGLPFKFGVRITDSAVIVTPTDRTWIDRMFNEGKDNCQKLTPAIHSFWYGYNSNIYDPARMPQGTVVNYTERRLLWILDWVQRTYQTDPNRVYAQGSSMGGCGCISFALRHPEIFAAVRAHVPIVAYGPSLSGDSTYRIVAETGGLDMPTNEGMTVRERLDATRFVRSYRGDLPFLVITNGRKDGSIPWAKNPDFYRAMQEARQGMIAAWDDGEHSTCGASLPPDVKAYNNLEAFHRLFARNKSYLAFSHASTDNNPGNGDPKDGDIAGFMGRGFTWEEPKDEAERYEVVVKWILEPAALPVTVDVTPRRLQAFHLAPGDQVTAINLDAASGAEVQKVTLTADAQGLVTFCGFQITSAAGNRLVLSR